MLNSFSHLTKLGAYSGRGAAQTDPPKEAMATKVKKEVGRIINSRMVRRG